MNFVLPIFKKEGVNITEHHLKDNLKWDILYKMKVMVIGAAFTKQIEVKAGEIVEGKPFPDL